MKACLPLLLLTCACASSSAGTSTGPGHINEEFVKNVAERQGVWRTKIFVDGQGAIYKLTIYHRDASVIPAAVAALAEKTFPGAKIESYELELYAEDGWVHEVEVTNADGRNCEVSSTTEGVLRYTECRMKPEELDPKIAAQVTELVPDGKMVEVERQEGPKSNEIRVEVLVANDIVHYFRFEPGGKLLAHDLRVPTILDLPAK